MLNNILLILSSVSLNAFAQLFIRKGMLITDKVSLSIDSMIKIVVAIFTNLCLLGGTICYVCSFFLWMIVLSKVNVSLAYPLGSIGYIITAGLAYVFLQEPMSMQKIFGILIICLGVYVLTQSSDFIK